MIRLPFAAALLGLAAAAGAQPPTSTPTAAAGVPFDQWAALARERLMALDTNHDGKICLEEFAARAAMMGHHGGMMGQHGADAGGDAGKAMPKHDGSKMFARFDTNADGYLDTSEIDAMLARRFARMDADHDRMLTPDERHAMHGMNAPAQ